MKLALVNLCKIEDFSKSPSYNDSMVFLKENGIDYADYMSDRATPEALLDGFHQALRDPSVDLVWFVQGGNALVTILEDIDWNLVATCGKAFFGLSDFTHFSLKSATLGATCYYGQGLKRVTNYLPTAADREFLVSFLKEGIVPPIAANLIAGNHVSDLTQGHIVGGYSIASAVLLPNIQLDLSGSFLFFEHHYLPGESLGDATYFLEAVKVYLRDNKPKGIILGHSLVSDQEGNWIHYEQINEHFSQALAELDVPIYSIDHFRTIVKLSWAGRP